MLNVDISNVWTRVSLPELLGTEKEVFDAHLRLTPRDPSAPQYLGWLNMTGSASGRLIHSVRKASEAICAQSDVLVVCGSGGGFLGARAAIDAYCGIGRNLLGHRPEILFTGGSLSSRQWLELTHLLEDKDVSLLLFSPDGQDLAPNVTARGLRWRMERKYGPKTKERVWVATLPESPLATMAKEEGYGLLTLPALCTDSPLTVGALLPMAAAGIDPLAVLEGAAEAYQAMDIRSFENPSWLYAAARSVLGYKGLNQELLCVPDHSFASLGHWWKRQVWRSQCREDLGLRADTILLPEDLEALDQLVCSGKAGVFETLLHFDPLPKKVPVEMDWKDYDGLGCLSGRNLDFVEDALLQAMVEAHNDAGVPILDIQAGELTAETLGQLFCFFEFSAALTAAISGLDPFALPDQPTRTATLAALAR